MMSAIMHNTPLWYLIQSFWRDEAYSVLFAQQSVWTILSAPSLEPPLYYLMLHFWIKIFGTSEIAVRSLSVLGFALAVVVVIYWAEKALKKTWLSWFAPLFFLLNPFLLYYAFEARAYAWYIFWTVLALYSYVYKKWRIFTPAIIVGFYTHTYFIFVPFICSLHFCITHTIWNHPGIVKRWKHEPMIRTILIFILAIIPWVIQLILFAPSVKSSWYYPVDFHLIKSVLGNMFLGYEGTPWYFWTTSALLSLILLVSFIIPLANKSTRKASLLFGLLVFVPLVIVIGISFIKPLFVNRYLVPVTIGEIFLLIYMISVLPKLIYQYLCACVFTCGILIFLVWFPPQHPKFDIRSIVNEINMLLQPTDVVYVDNPLYFFETKYYSAFPSRTYWYNQTRAEFPWYIGGTLFSKSDEQHALPVYPNRAFIIKADGSYIISFAVPAKTQKK